MDLLLLGLCVTFFSVAVAAAAFSASMRSGHARDAQPEVPAADLTQEGFFSDKATSGIPIQPQVPVELLLQQIEDHVRLEQALAESVIAFPAQAQLQSKSSSPFLN